FHSPDSLIFSTCLLSVCVTLGLGEGADFDPKCTSFGAQQTHQATQMHTEVSAYEYGTRPHFIQCIMHVRRLLMPELWINIFSYLDHANQGSVRLASKHSRQLMDAKREYFISICLLDTEPQFQNP